MASATSLKSLRALVHDCLGKHMYDAAVFFADKLVAMSSGGWSGAGSEEADPADVYTLAQALFIDGQHRRCLQILNNAGVVERDIRFRYLAARCLAASKEWDECLEMLGGIDAPVDPAKLPFWNLSIPSSSPEASIDYAAAICLLRGEVFDAMDNFAKSVEWYKAALKADPMCYDAFARLVGGHKLTENEEAELVADIRERLPPGVEWLGALYLCKANQYNKRRQEDAESALQSLQASPAWTGPGMPYRSRGSASLETSTDRKDSLHARESAGDVVEQAESREESLPRRRKMSMDSGSTRQRIRSTDDTGASGGGNQNHHRISHQRDASSMPVETLSHVPQSREREVSTRAETRRAQEIVTMPRSRDGMEDMDTAMPARSQTPPYPEKASEVSYGASDGQNGNATESADVVTPAGVLSQRSTPGVPLGGWGLANSHDVIACRAELLFRQNRFRECYAITSAVVERDPFAESVLPVHVATAVRLEKRNELFQLAHTLVKSQPGGAMPWYVVGCYYYVTKQFTSARQYFGKATSIDRNFAPAWVAFAQAFACQDETDQALAAFRTASRLFPGLHASVLGMGLEYLRMNNHPLAEQMLREAHHRCPSDPTIAHEMGTLAFRCEKYQEAVAWLEKSLELSGGSKDDTKGEYIEATLVNLGHAFRKLHRFEDAIAVLTRALGVNTVAPGTYAALGYTHHLCGDLSAAIDNYHKSLGLRGEDAFVANMLAIAIEEEGRIALESLT